MLTLSEKQKETEAECEGGMVEKGRQKDRKIDNLTQVEMEID